VKFAYFFAFCYSALFSQFTNAGYFEVQDREFFVTLDLKSQTGRFESLIEGKYINGPFDIRQEMVLTGKRYTLLDFKKASLKQMEFSEKHGNNYTIEELIEILPQYASHVDKYLLIKSNIKSDSISKSDYARLMSLVEAKIWVTNILIEQDAFTDIQEIFEYILRPENNFSEKDFVSVVRHAYKKKDIKLSDNLLDLVSTYLTTSTQAKLIEFITITSEKFDEIISNLKNGADRCYALRSFVKNNKPSKQFCLNWIKLFKEDPSWRFDAIGALHPFLENMNDSEYAELLNSSDRDRLAKYFPTLEAALKNAELEKSKNEKRRKHRRLPFFGKKR
jgi:hypothetical protein